MILDPIFQELITFFIPEPNYVIKVGDVFTSKPDFLGRYHVTYTCLQGGSIEVNYLKPETAFITHGITFGSNDVYYLKPEVESENPIWESEHNILVKVYSGESVPKDEELAELLIRKGNISTTLGKLMQKDVELKLTYEDPSSRQFMRFNYLSLPYLTDDMVNIMKFHITRYLSEELRGVEKRIKELEDGTT